MLELTNETRGRVTELRPLAQKTQGGEEGARRELRRALRRSAPEVIARCSTALGTYRGMLAGSWRRAMCSKRRQSSSRPSAWL